ncbi:MAG: anti-sigma F factor [Clostridia bacterium]|nr:anti-sigma F factor [Clostridia bacterium]
MRKATERNIFKAEFPAKSVNERFARSTVAAFAAQADPTVSVIADLKTAVSEAVTNCIVHAYRDRKDRAKCPVYIYCSLDAKRRLTVKIRDKGVGIEDVQKAMQPLYTTDTDGERSGMGFAVMQNLCDRVKVSSRPGKGTVVTLVRAI